ncbi:uncharacterized protein WCC33_008042 [Rhinophrynus dorsalis]
MCNEKTATYWTGGGTDSVNGEEITDSIYVKEGQFDVDRTDPYYPMDNNPPQSNVRLYFPLQKTLRNLRLLDLKLRYNSRQAAVEHTAHGDTQDSSSSSDESDARPVEQEEKEEIRQEDDTEQTKSSSLIHLLSQCHLKLQQMEVLEHYSEQLARSLWEAQETIVYLRENMAALQRENAQKGNEIFILSEELAESRRLLCEKTDRIADMKEMFRNLGDHLENRTRERRFEYMGQIQDNSGKSSESPVPREMRNSNVCVIV